MTDEKNGPALSEPAPQPDTNSELDDARAQIAQRDKEFATLRAELALAGGYQLQIIDRDGEARYLVSRWNLCKELPDREAVRRFIRQVGGAA